MKLNNAVAGMNRTEILRLLNSGEIDINWKDRNGTTALIAAAKTTVDIVKLLLERGASVNASNRDGDLPLHVSLREGRKQIAKLLIECGSDLRHVSKAGVDPLLCAVLYRQDDIVQVILESPRPVSLELCFLHAAERNRIDLLNTLKDKGVNVNFTDKTGNTALMLASKEGHEEAVGLLLQLLEVDVSYQSKATGHTALLLAAINKNTQIARLLLTAGSATSSVSKYKGMSALLYATKQCDRELVELLLSHGADPNCTDDRGSSALIYAICGQQLLATSLINATTLITAGADVTLANLDGDTALHLVRDEAMVATLIARGANVNAVNAQGKTALMLATDRNELNMMRTLISAGCVIDLKDKAGDSALTIAVRLMFVSAVRQLLTSGANPCTANKDGCTALILAAKTGHAAIVEMLVIAGSDVNSFNNDKSSAVLCAARQGNFYIVLYLISFGADIDHKDQEEKTPLDYLSNEVQRDDCRRLRSEYLHWQRRRSFMLLLVGTGFIPFSMPYVRNDVFMCCPSEMISQRAGNYEPPACARSLARVLSNLDLSVEIAKFL